jgi:glycosyltransferase involved in cell wall biosynthesis
MRFSVICTNYNKEPYIAECIESVLIQEFHDFELIIIDDASTDQSASIIVSYLNKYPDKITFIQNDFNVGMAASYNKALSIAKGELISLIDSDDFWFPGKLAEVHRCFREHNDCVMHQHLLQVYQFANKTENLYRPYLITGNLFDYIKETNQIPLFVATTGLSFRMKELKNILPIPETFKNNGEAFITRTIICYGNVVTSQFALGAYRKTDRNLVFGNASWDPFHYVETLLKPELNLFYKNKGIDLFLLPIQLPKKNSYIVRYILSKIKRLRLHISTFNRIS